MQAGLEITPHRTDSTPVCLSDPIQLPSVIARLEILISPFFLTTLIGQFTFYYGSDWSIKRFPYSVLNQSKSSTNSIDQSKLLKKRRNRLLDLAIILFFCLNYPGGGRLSDGNGVLKKYACASVCMCV